MEFVYNYPGALDKTTYDLENMIADPTRRIEAFIESLISLNGTVLADIGAGGGYHACLYGQRAAAVFAIEPAPAMLRQLYARVAESGLTNVSILAAGAEQVLLRDRLVDIVHSRFAYFFGPEGGTVHSCERGIAEALRVLKPGGYFFIIDNALTSGQFAGILSRYGYSRGQAEDMQARNDTFYAGHGFANVTIESTWTAPDREALRQVMAMEFPDQPIDALMAEIEGSELTYHYRIHYRQK
jgi:ubiquinone/menaquinone biosynthesis C-methylase UbiE